MPVDMRDIAVSFQGEEMNTIFLEPVYRDTDIRSTFRYVNVPGNKKKLGFVQELEKVVRQYTSCGFQPIGNVSIYDRCIEVERLRADLVMCWEEFKDTIFEESFKRGVAMPDLTGTIVFNILEDMVRNAVIKDNMRLAFFGNKAVADPAYNSVDGFWSVYLPQFVTANQAPYFNTNSGAALSSGDGIEFLRTVYDNADVRLKGLPTNLKKFFVSGSIAMQYREDLENASGIEGAYRLLQDGSEVLTFRGVEVVPMWTWDTIMTADFNAPNTHFILYTTPDNLALGGDVTDTESLFRVWYDEEDEQVKIKTRYKMGFQVIHPSLLSVGY
jgi:hypothetical protein